MLIRSCLPGFALRPLNPVISRQSAYSTVALAHDHYPAPTSADKNQSPLVILHGLFGSKQNWRSLSKALAQKLGREVYTLDLRNHGDSPHNAGATYKHYAEDVNDFLKQKNLKDTILMGHSMGGKVAMAQALSAPESISKLIVIDITPARAGISSDFVKYVDAMREVQSANVSSKKEGDKILQPYEESLPIRQFLLTNLVKDQDTTKYKIRLPLDVISDSIDDIGDFPYAPEDGVRFEKPTLFIKGAESKYINRKNIPVAEQMFPNMRLETIAGAGHWVHSEKPNEFMDIVDTFCK